MGIKVFDFQLLVGRESIMGDKPRVSITAIATCEKNLYVGTNDCFIHHFVLQETKLPDTEKQIFSVKQQDKKHIGMKKPIVQIKAASALNHLLVNSDNTLVLFSMLNLSVAVSVSGKIKNMSRFSINERPLNRSPFAIEICVSYLKKKTLQIFQIYVDKVVPMHEVSFPDHPKNFCIDGKHICCVTSTFYYIVNFEANTKQELFQVEDSGKSCPIIKVTASEFLISANGLGVFVSSDGTSNRPPLQWSNSVLAASLLQPYVVAVDEDFITVHSLLDQQQKQTLSFQGCVRVCCCDIGVIAVCSAKDIFILVPVPLQSQLDSLITEKQVDEAITLLKLSKKKLTSSQFQTKLNRIYCMSGFVKLETFELDKALRFFIEGCMDPREVVCLFPDLIPKQSEFKRAIPPYNEITEIDQVCENDRAKIVHCQEFLALYLEMIFSEIFLINFKELQQSSRPKFSLEMDNDEFACQVCDLFYSTVLLLALLDKSKELQQFVVEITKKLSDSSIMDIFISNYFKDLLIGLEKFGCYHVCALFQYACGDFNQALQVWRSIALDEIKDVCFPGLSFVAEKIAETDLEPNLLWQNAEWILKIDQNAGVQIFTNQKLNAEKIQPDDVIDFLHHYPDAVIEYLYHLVMVQKLQKEKFHTHLAVLYLEKVLKLLASRHDVLKLEAARTRLQSILVESDLYRIPLILGKASEAQLFEEQVILHSKLGEHEKALSILVKNLNDSKAAKEYCLTKSKNDLVLRRQLFQELISVYLQDISSNKNSKESTAAVVELLNQHPEDFEPERVLRILPSDWSIAILSQFLHNSVRAPYHEFRTKKIENMLLKAELLRLHRERTKLCSVPVVMNENRICYLCNRPLNNSTFMRYPNGIIIHSHCSRDKHVCPVTGKIFKIKKSSFSNNSA